jgi:hypothetical protein
MFFISYLKEKPENGMFRWDGLLGFFVRNALLAGGSF